MDSPPHVDPALLARLAAELDGLQRQVGALSHTVALLQRSAQPVAWPAQPAQPMPPQMPAQPGQPIQPLPPVVRPTVPQYAPQQQWRPTPPRPPRQPWWEREGMVSRVLAVAGAGVTLIGVVLMVVLAAQAGWFGPVARVIAGAVLSGVLVALAFRVHARPGGQIGAVALAATGIAGAYLDVIAITSIYEWFHPVVGLAIALAIAAAGLALAARWQALALAQIVIVGVALLAPIITKEPNATLIAFLTILQVVGWAAQWFRHWPTLHVTRTAPVVLALMAAIGVDSLSSTIDRAYLELPGAAVVAVVGIATSAASVVRRPHDTLGGAVLGVAAIPLLMVGVLFETNAHIAIAAVTAGVLLTVALVPQLNSAARLSALIAGVLAVVELCFTVPGDGGPSIAVSLAALSFLGASVSTKARAAYWVGAGLALLNALVFLSFASVDELVDEREAVIGLGGFTVVASVLLIATLVALVWQGVRLQVFEQNQLPPIGAVVGIAGVYAFTAALVAIGVSVGGSGGFTAGHCAATVCWMLAATLVLLYGLKSPASAHLALFLGLTLTAAAVGKLFLFDLAMLSGLTRAIAFLGVGLLLLGAGTKYARAFAERDEHA
ncbi:MAG: DUF2339 domain-containing protein [Nocardiaceae bacterium]|nr:DUF2339 domain-containing protein [Nocardiaceae bacterium]